jgi:hypothetical protein
LVGDAAIEERSFVAAFLWMTGNGGRSARLFDALAFGVGI